MHGILVKDQIGSIITEAWKDLQSIFQKVGVVPEIFVLDNKMSKELIEAFSNELNMQQLVTLCKYRNS